MKIPGMCGGLLASLLMVNGFSDSRATEPERLVTWSSYGDRKGGFVNPGRLEKPDGIWRNEVSRTDPDAVNRFSVERVEGVNYEASTAKLNSAMFDGRSHLADPHRMTFKFQNVPSMDADRYISFTVAPESGYQLDLTELRWNVMGAPNSNPSYSIRSSLDNFQSDLAMGELHSGVNNPLDTALPEDYRSIASAIEFRFQFWGSVGENITYFVDKNRPALEVYGRAKPLQASAKSGSGTPEPPSPEVGIDKSGESEPTPNLPNIVLVTTDDMGIQVGAYGDPNARTPALDRLAREGVMFTNAFAAQSSCSPSRAAILSGLWPHQNGQIGLEPFGYGMFPGTKTLFDWLGAAGYHRGWFGKVHVGPDMSDSWDSHPFASPDGRKIDYMADEARNFITASRKTPFFLYFNLTDPHAPFFDQVEGVPEKPMKASDIVTPDWVGIDDQEINALLASFYNCVWRADSGIGKLMEVLQEAGHFNDTLFIFTTDGGAPLPRSKTTNYDFGVRIPLILHWPGRIEPGLRVEQLVEQVDIAPTILEAANIAVPENLPGRSLLPLARGQKPDDWRKYAFTQHTAHVTHHYFPRRTVTDGRYQLIWNMEGGTGRETPYLAGDRVCEFIIGRILEKAPDSAPARGLKLSKTPPEFELYDLENDPLQVENLAENLEYEQTLAQLQNAIHQWQEATDDYMRSPKARAEVTRWHDELISQTDPLPGKKRARSLDRDYVRPQYFDLIKRVRSQIQ